MKRLLRRSVQALHAYVPGEQPKDPNVVKLNTNENPYPPSPAVEAALSGITPGRLARYPDPMSTGFRKAAAELHGCGLEQVMAGNGSDEILALCIRAFVEQDGSVGYFDPSYSLYPVLCDIAEVGKRPVPLGPEFSWSVPDKFSCPLFFITNPNAPTSMLFPRNQVEAFCRNFEGVVVIDEAYVDFAPAHCMDLALSLPNVIVMRTLSKGYSLAGIRLGYAVGHKELVDALFKVKDSYNVNMLTQAAGEAALRDQAWMKGNVRKIVATRERVTRELSSRGYSVQPSSSNFLWARPPVGVEASAVFEHLRRNHVFIRYFPGPKTGAYLRITIGTDEQMDRFLAAL